LVTAAIARIEAIDSVLNAVVIREFDRAVDASRGPLPDAPFTGVPFLLKDLAVEWDGVRFTGGSAFLRDNVSSHDQELTRRIRQAGLVLAGKTNTPEFGALPTCEPALFGPTRNPWDPNRTPGGSSGGAAAAVASGMVPMAYGNDAGGSIRYPASCCGVFGLKPARGRVSPAPFHSLEGLSTAGPISRSVEDAARFLDVLAGYEPGDPWWTPEPERPFADEAGVDPGRLRIAAASQPPIDTPVHEDCAAALRSAAALLEDLGHVVVEAAPPWGENELIDSFIVVWQVSPTLYPIDPEHLTPLNRGLVEAARRTSSEEYANATMRLQESARRIVAFWSEVDVVLTPTLALPPVPIGWQLEGVDDAIEQLRRNTVFTPFTAVANLTGLPAMSLPLHGNGEGLPIGVQAIGAPAGEATLIRLASQLEAARPWSLNRPPIS
jgi:amidase